MKASSAFLLLMGAQAAHSIEEYSTELYDVLAPARIISDLISSDRATGFAVANLALVSLGLWCWAYPIRRRWPSARVVIAAWCALEIANGCGHLMFALGARGYFPGLATAPLLLIAATVTLIAVIKRPDLDARAPSP